MTDDEKHVLESIKNWVWSGFYNEARAADNLAGLYEDDPNLKASRSEMQAALAAEFKAKADAEKSWPRETDCDRLDRAFAALDKAGVVALHNAGYTMSDGYSDVSEALAENCCGTYHGFCFYHFQDIEYAVRHGGLMIAFGDLDEDDAKTIAVGHEVCKALAHEGFKTEWNGTKKNRIEIPKLDWKRRTPK